MILKEVLDKTIGHFQNLGFDRPRLEAELLLADALDWQRIDLYTKFEYPLNPSDVERCREHVRRRSKGEPLAYISGKKDFYTSRFFVEKGVLIPRPDTETLIEVALKEVMMPPNYIVDLGCGSGCIGLSLLKEWNEAKLLAVDISEKAIELTKKNAKHLNLSDRVETLEQDLYLGLQDDRLKNADVILCNPPYISKEDKEVEPHVAEYEPNEALYAEEKGLKAYQEWIVPLYSPAKEGALFVLECGWKQKEDLIKMFSTAGITNIMSQKDLADRDRVIYFKKESRHG